MDKKVVVMDNGTGYTKMGWAGNPEPTYDIPTVVALNDQFNKKQVQVSKTENQELDFYIGHEAYQQDSKYQIFKPMSSGVIDNWDLMEKLWHRSIYDYMRCEPEESVFILTEPPLNSPENRESMAEIFFETFNAEGLYIGVQAVLALYSNYWSPLNQQQQNNSLTGTVLDSGDGVTHVIPVSDGYVIGSCIKHIPLAGRDITQFISKCLKERGETKNFDIKELEKISSMIKEKYGYVSEHGVLEEFRKYDQKKPGQDKSKFFKQLKYEANNKQMYLIDVGYERFLGPEMFFHPEFLDSKYRTSVVDCIDTAIQGSPIDSRRALYNNIVLSGGSTLFENFSSRLQNELQTKIDDRLNYYQQQSGQKPNPISVNVAANPFQRFSVWQGGSLLATNAQFKYHTKQQYEEYGSAIARINPVVAPGM